MVMPRSRIQSDYRGLTDEPDALAEAYAIDASSLPPG